VSSGFVVAPESRAGPLTRGAVTAEPMHVGVDFQQLRWPEAGLFFFAQHLFEALCRVSDGHRITPLLYGHRWMVEAEHVCRFATAFPDVPLRYYWDGPRPRVLSGWFRHSRPQPPWLVRQLDRRLLLPLWVRASRWRLTQRTTAALTRFGLRASPFAGIDVFHHFNFVVFPIHRRANVLTIADLTTLRVPHFHTEGTLNWQRPAYESAPLMDLIITISEHTKRDAVELLGIEPDRVRVTPLAAHECFRPLRDPEALRELRERYGLGNRPYILTVGTLEPRKNHCRLIEAFARLRRRDPGLIHRLVLVGAKGWLFEPIFETVRRLGLEGHVRWLDYVPFDDLPGLMSGTELFVYPSLYEGFGLPPLEAMSCGAPVIASATTSLPEVVGEAGILVDPEQVDEITAAMHRVLTDPHLRTALRAAGLERAKQFTWERTARMTLAAYDEARDRHARSGPTRRTLLHVDSDVRREVHRWVMAKSVEYAKKIIHPVGF
jgi:glycosyltransferase involved in cell wall biosynthesis